MCVARRWKRLRAYQPDLLPFECCARLWPMRMSAGYALFRDPALNAQLKRVLNCWCGFLSGPHSREHLSRDFRAGGDPPVRCAATIRRSKRADQGEREDRDGAIRTILISSQDSVILRREH